MAIVGQSAPLRCRLTTSAVSACVSLRPRRKVLVLMFFPLLPGGRPVCLDLGFGVSAGASVAAAEAAKLAIRSSFVMDPCCAGRARNAR